MVNHREKQILKKYEKKGYKTVRCGCPDFLFIKTNNGEIIESIFVEVKSPQDHLSYEQYIWKLVLEQGGFKYKVEVI